MLIVISVVLACCQKSSTPTSTVEVPPVAVADADYHLLFIGNSLTYFNDLPELVRAEGIANDKSIAVETVANPNYGLEDHWNDGIVQRLIRSKKFQFVIIQQGPSSQRYGRESLLEFGSYLKDLCDDHDAQLAFFMVWPSREYYHTFNGVIRNYTMAADSTQSLLCPVGSEWKSHFDATNDFSYYGPDEFHPSPKGSLVAAKVIYSTLFGSL